jgi:hypothetical protein
MTNSHTYLAFPTLKKEAVDSSKMLVTTEKTTGLHNPEDNPNFHHSEKLILNTTFIHIHYI